MQDPTAMHKFQSLNLAFRVNPAAPARSRWMPTHYLHRDTTDAPKVHNLFATLSIYTIQALAEEIDGEIIPFTYDTSIPESGHTLTALD
jgi:hypothetical protein